MNTNKLNFPLQGMEVFIIKKDPETLKKLEALGRKMDHDIWVRQQRRRRQQLKAWRRLRRKGYL